MINDDRCIGLLKYPGLIELMFVFFFGWPHVDWA